MTLNSFLKPWNRVHLIHKLFDMTQMQMIVKVTFRQNALRCLVYFGNKDNGWNKFHENMGKLVIHFFFPMHWILSHITDLPTYYGKITSYQTLIPGRWWKPIFPIFIIWFSTSQRSPKRLDFSKWEVFLNGSSYWGLISLVLFVSFNELWGKKWGKLCATHFSTFP